MESWGRGGEWRGSKLSTNGPIEMEELGRRGVYPKDVYLERKCMHSLSRYTYEVFARSGISLFMYLNDAGVCLGHQALTLVLIGTVP